jgi:hypothetical protein
MNIRMTLLRLALVTASAASLTALAAIPNPDNESTAAFTYKSSAGAIGQTVALPRAGDVSSDGRLVYSGGDRGWVRRAHSFVYMGGSFAHASDCAPYNDVPAVETSVPIVQTGAFAEHGV